MTSNNLKNYILKVGLLTLNDLIKKNPTWVLINSRRSEVDPRNYPPLPATALNLLYIPCQLQTQAQNLPALDSVVLGL